MACCRRRVGIGLRLAAPTLSGIGLAAFLGAAAADAASAKGGRAAEIAGSRPAAAAVMAIVSLNQQRVTVYDAEGQILQAPVSTGQIGYETPAGIFSVLERKVEHYSNLYDDASMPFMQRLTWSGIALHAGVLPGRPASHGCIRLPIAFAERLFEHTKLGMRVIVVRDDISPVELAHPALFRPLRDDAPQPVPGVASGTGSEGAEMVPAHVADASASVPTLPRRSLRAIAAAKAEAAARAAENAEEARMAARSATIEAARAVKAIRRAEGAKARAELQLRRAEQLAESAGAGEAVERAQHAKTAAQAAFNAALAELERTQAEMQPKVDLVPQLRQQAKEAHEASLAAKEEAKEAARKTSPVSVFISRATQRLYVKQSREAAFETPVSIAEADQPLGTYVFTALAHADGGADLRWSVVSMYRSVHEPRPGSARHGERRNVEAVRADLAGATLALDRIAIPKEASERLSEMVGPGTSLIVSDEPLSRETGPATEFIVVMSKEPQGALKIRRRLQDLEARYRSPRPSGGSPFGWSGPSFLWWR